MASISDQLKAMDLPSYEYLTRLNRHEPKDPNAKAAWNTLRAFACLCGAGDHLRNAHGKTAAEVDTAKKAHETLMVDVGIKYLDMNSPTAEQAVTETIARARIIAAWDFAKKAGGGIALLGTIIGLGGLAAGSPGMIKTGVTMIVSGVAASMVIEYRNQLRAFVEGYLNKGQIPSLKMFAYSPAPVPQPAR